MNIANYVSLTITGKLTERVSEIALLVSLERAQYSNITSYLLLDMQNSSLFIGL